MVPAGVAFAGALGLLAALVYAILGRLELLRARSTHAFAAGALGVFWLGLGFHLALDSVWGVAAAAGRVPPELSETALHLKIASAVVAFAGLVYHVLYVYSGSRRIAPLVAGYFAVAFALVEFNYLSRGPLGHEMTAWAAHHAFALAGGAFEDVVLTLLFLPGIVASIMYAVLARTTTDPVLRRRVVLRALGLAGFFGGLLVGFLAEWSWWEPAERLLALVTGLAALRAAAFAEDAAAQRGPQPS